MNPLHTGGAIKRAHGAASAFGPSETTFSGHELRYDYEVNAGSSDVLEDSIATVSTDMQDSPHDRFEASSYGPPDPQRREHELATDIYATMCEVQANHRPDYLPDSPYVKYRRYIKMNLPFSFPFPHNSPVTLWLPRRHAGISWIGSPRPARL